MIINDIQNCKPEDYPYIENTKTSEDFLIVDDGVYVVDDEGCLLEVTSGNRKHLEISNEFLRDLNIGYIRAKYLGNKDDFLWYANRIRLATEEEIQKYKKWLKNRSEPLRVSRTGQMYLF